MSQEGKKEKILGETRQDLCLWDSFLNGVMLKEEWRENFRMSCMSFF